MRARASGKTEKPFKKQLCVVIVVVKWGPSDKPTPITPPLVLIIGDQHILVPGEIQQALCTKMCATDTFGCLRSVVSDVVVVKGDYDEVHGFATPCVDPLVI